MQIGILNGLNKLHDEITVVTETPIASYPKEKKILIKSGNIEISDGIQAKVVPFVNIFVLKQITMIICSFFILLKWAIKNRKEKMTIITFNPFPYTAIPTILVSSIFKIKKICIFADPPIDAVKRSSLGKIAKYFENKSTEINIKKYDGLVVLNEKAVEKYSPNTKFILVDGGFDVNDIPENNPGGQWLQYSEGDIVDIVFSGGLYEYNGLVNLIQAFKTIDSKKLRLNIYGEGPLKEYVVDSSIINDMIVYHGNVPNELMVRIQQKSALLINPRLTNDPISLYTFPSKMIEYMLSGTPVLTTELNGLTTEYLRNLFVIESNTVREIAESIECVSKLSKDELIMKATKARDFIINNKTWDIQCEKIYNFIKNI